MDEITAAAMRRARWTYDPEMDAIYVDFFR
jgi:hypothetical protein